MLSQKTRYFCIMELAGDTDCAVQSLDCGDSVLFRIERYFPRATFVAVHQLCLRFVSFHRRKQWLHLKED